MVASEVRQLAMRSAAAASEIKGLISDSVEKVESGTAVVKEAGSTIEEIVIQSRRVNDLLAEIAIGAKEQAVGVQGWDVLALGCELAGEVHALVAVGNVHLAVAEVD